MTKNTKNTVGSSNYDKIKNAVDKVDQDIENIKNNEEIDENTKTRASERKEARQARKKVYEPVTATDIPAHIVQRFKEDNYELRWIRFRLDGQEDYKSLYKREQEGYEYVTQDELPSDFLVGIRIVDGKSRQGLVTSGDVCLMKVDTDLRQSRRDYYKNKTNNEIQAADVWNITKKGFRDLGSKSSISYGKEPNFQ